MKVDQKKYPTMALRFERRRGFFASGENGDSIDSYEDSTVLQQKFVFESGVEEWIDVPIVDVRW